MLLNVLYALICVAVMGLTPLFVKSQKDGACPKSLLIKMVCATGYIAVGVLACVINGEITVFAKIMLGALIASWIGDLFLHLWFSKAFYVIGFLGFLSAHFFFIAAYHEQITVLDPEQAFLGLWQILVMLVLVGLFLVLTSKSDFELKGIIKVGIIIYGMVIVTMMCKAISLAVTSISVGVENACWVAVLSIVGAVCFVASDFTISLLMFSKKHKKNIPLKMFNMLTYFAAELLLASLILVIK